VISPEEIAETIDSARDYLQNRDGSDSEVSTLDFAETLVQVVDACVIGLPCEKHGGAVHGQEAEELRKGVEQALSNTANVSLEEAAGVLKELRASLYFLLDQVDARDSLAFLEKKDAVQGVIEQ